MTKIFATLLFILGGALLGIGLALSVSVTPEVTPVVNAPAGQATCTDCHQDTPNHWQMAPHSMLLTSSGTPATPECTSCHIVGASNLDAMQTATSSSTDARLLLLRHQLADVYADHPTWQHTHIQKTQAQVTAEQVEVILSLIEADSNWGFHSAAYTNAQLDNAETLLTTLKTFNR